MKNADVILEVFDLKNHLGGRWVHDGIHFTVSRGEIIAIIGASGCGKTTLLRSILMLHSFTSGKIKVFNTDVKNSSEAKKDQLRKRWGVMFQSGALFGALTVAENIMFPMDVHTTMSFDRKMEIARLKLALVGLEQEAGLKYPAELSGGMKKRAAAARAIAIDPELLFLDEPTAGLDPNSASEIDELVLHLRDQLGLTIVLVTHDLDTLWSVPDRVIFLGEGKVLAAMSMQELVQHPHPLIKGYFSGARAKWRAAAFGDHDGV